MTKLQIILALVAASGVSYVSGVATSPQAMQQVGGLGDGIAWRTLERIMEKANWTWEDVARAGRVGKARVSAEETFAKEMGHEAPPVRMEYVPAPEPVTPEPTPTTTVDVAPAPPATPPQLLIFGLAANCPACNVLKKQFAEMRSIGWKIDQDGTKPNADWIYIDAEEHPELWQKFGKSGGSYPHCVIVSGDTVIDRASLEPKGVAFRFAPENLKNPTGKAWGFGAAGLAEWLNVARAK